MAYGEENLWAKFKFLFVALTHNIDMSVSTLLTFVLLPLTMLPYHLLHVGNNKLSLFPYSIYDALQVGRHVKENQ
jgi:hypothetical protein